MYMMYFIHGYIYLINILVLILKTETLDKMKLIKVKLHAKIGVMLLVLQEPLSRLTNSIYAS